MIKVFLIISASVVALMVYVECQKRWNPATAAAATVGFFAVLWLIEHFERAGEARWILVQAALVGCLSGMVIWNSEKNLLPFLPNWGTAIAFFIFVICLFANSEQANEEGDVLREPPEN